MLSALAGLALLATLMFLAWSALLVRRTTATRGGERPRRLLAATAAAGAAAAKEHRTWSRDLLYGHRVVFAVAYGLFFCLMPLAVGWTGMLPWAGAAAVIMGGAMFANLYGADGTAYRLTLMTPGSARYDVRARQHTFLVVFAPITVVITILLTWWSGRSGTALPAVVTAIYAGWWGVPVGLGTGTLAWWYLGHLAAGRLERRGPELLTLLRHGRTTSEPPDRKSRWEQLPRRQRTLVGFCAGFGAIPLFPQAVVPAVFKLTGNDAKVWFLALYLEPGRQWPMIAAMAALGLGMYTYAGVTYVQKTGQNRSSPA